MHERVEIGYQAFLQGEDEEFGAVRGVSPERRAVTVYVENAGDFEISGKAIVEVHDEKVIFDVNELDTELLTAIGHAHDREVPHL
jgi:hypothetical protein